MLRGIVEVDLIGTNAEAANDKQIFSLAHDGGSYLGF